ncbi:hypothetical protein HOP50_01g01760 [Chloropicon primus]|nr:hypothetical protein HOP50_01g01760 [Chloropicon primus]
MLSTALGESLRQALCFGAGSFLRRTDALSPGDGLAAHRLLLTLLIPTLLVGLGVNAGSFLEPGSRVLAACGLAHFLLLFSSSLLGFRSLPAKDKGTATALVTCVSCCFSGLPGARGSLAQARLVLLGDLPAALLSFVAAALVVVRTRGRLLGGAMPGKYKHADGGVYSGEWKGFSKHGFGTYTYPSGSIYSGEWRENAKDGCGTYRYGTGGAYIGDWRKGNPWGVGIRVYKSGKVAHGNFVNGKLESELPADVCEAAVERSLRASKQASSIAKERNQPFYQRLVTEVADILPICLVLLALRLPRVFSVLISAETTRAVLLFFAPLAALAYGLQSAFRPQLSDSTLLDVQGMLSFRYGVSCLFAGLALLLAPPGADFGIILSCALCPASPLLMLVVDKYTAENKDFVRAVLGWSMVLSLALTACAQILCEVQAGSRGQGERPAVVVGKPSAARCRVLRGTTHVPRAEGRRQHRAPGRRRNAQRISAGSKYCKSLRTSF